jgi:hypothetical protein
MGKSLAIQLLGGSIKRWKNNNYYNGLREIGCGGGR